MYETIEVANYLLGLSYKDKIPVNPMKLLKLVYIAHGWYMVFYDGPLINERIECGEFGPNIRSVYHKVKRYGNDPIPQKIKYKTDGFDKRAKRSLVGATDLLDTVWLRYKDLTAIQLSNMCHKEGSPWKIVWDYGGSTIRGTNIPNELIEQHYKNLVGESKT